ncbi:hypothetical protein B4U80_13646 [Leptotrombidium deliense]|uniref:MSP domain-containing protein n=1 Tax=Leptotrombidium deliense TaxID=299467 RepID=A0A443SPZ4_9ACAR|nr:hypothetical protein B4U80_13646 [Leptotrombidium deliense]
MSSYTHFSDGFHLLLDVWPKGYLTFPSKEVRGSSLSKASLTIENVNKKPVAYRIVNEQNSTLKLRASPTYGILIPGAAQRVEIINTTDHPSCISDRVYIEAIIYDKDLSSTTSENILDLFGEKSVDFYCLKCYETNDLALIPMQEEMFRVEQRLKAMDCALKSVRTES